jgi:hypothetical protein
MVSVHLPNTWDPNIEEQHTEISSIAWDHVHGTGFSNIKHVPATFSYFSSYNPSTFA